jgi:hypothetical protein
MRKYTAEILSALLSMASTFLAPLWGFIVLIGLLVVFDTLTYLAAAANSDYRQADKTFQRATGKIVLYFVAILLSEGMVIVFGIPHHALTFVVAFLIAAREFRSNIINIELATGADIWTGIQNLFTSGSKRGRQNKGKNGNSN